MLPVFALLLAFRLVNALTLRTFFQPDEFFQSLEPAWQLAFGPASRAWITWEWENQLRSSLHPALFAAAYRVAALLADRCGWTLSAKAELLLATPKLLQAVFAALLDCYTWRLAEKVYGRASRTAFITLAISLCSPWQWFCSTRTLSNCLETTFTAIAVYYWPWYLSNRKQTPVAAQRLNPILHLRLSLLVAALACVLRPTNILIWLPIALPTLWQAPKTVRYILVREALLCGSAVLGCSLLADRAYYGIWTLPAARFLYFNIARSLAVFYGRNRADYYFTEGLPLLLTTALPFAAVGLWQALRRTSPGPNNHILSRLAWTSLLTPLTLSLISHKEVRFLYPILPLLHILAAQPLATFLPPRAPFTRRALITLLLIINIALAALASQHHQRGVLTVLHHLRHKHEALNHLSHHSPSSPPPTIHNTTVAFLMPCHSTPWRSHLVHPHISAWALTCEPPLHVPLSERAAYLDEADVFYASPARWLLSNMESLDTVRRSGSRSAQFLASQDAKFKSRGRREWPGNLVFFAALEDDLRGVLGGSRYRECWRGGNSWAHDDWRREGDVVVWCLD